MIKCNVTVSGTVSRQAQIRANKEGKQFVSFGVNVVIPAKSGINKTMDISVAKDCVDQTELGNYRIGERIEIMGVLQFHKKGDILYLNLSASNVNTANVSDKDEITGDIEFRGTIGKQVETKNDKKGNPYSQFSAYSSEKDGDSYAFTWVRFVQFGKAKEEWIQPKAGINAKGALQLSIYNDRLDITCNANELTPWEKKTFTPNQH